jgi:hypothetical protein
MKTTRLFEIRTEGTVPTHLSVRFEAVRWGCRNPTHLHFSKQYQEMCRRIEEAEERWDQGET